MIGIVFFGWGGAIVGGALGVMCHVAVKPYLGLHPFKVKQIENESCFIDLKKWMVPEGDKRIDSDGINFIENNASDKSKERLRDLARSQGFITHYDFLNSALLDMQLWKRIEKKMKDNSTLSDFISREN